MRSIQRICTLTTVFAWEDIYNEQMQVHGDETHMPAPSSAKLSVPTMSAHACTAKRSVPTVSDITKMGMTRVPW